MIQLFSGWLFLSRSNSGWRSIAISSLLKTFQRNYNKIQRFQRDFEISLIFQNFNNISRFQWSCRLNIQTKIGCQYVFHCTEPSLQINCQVSGAHVSDFRYSDFGFQVSGTRISGFGYPIFSFRAPGLRFSCSRISGFVYPVYSLIILNIDIFYLRFKN